MPSVVTRITLLSREELDAQIPPCGCGGGHAADLSPSCHPGLGVRATYWQGRLALFCLVCERPFFGVPVASRGAC